ncbi:MAG: DUF2335 domain-containing protein [Magnetococcus sp. MYC-9]
MSDPTDNVAQVVPQPDDGGANLNPNLVVLQRAQQYVGPIPPPQMLAEYGKIVPDFPERIVKRFEEEGAHRAAMEKEMWAFQRRGQWMALSMGLFALACSWSLTLYGHDAVGGIVGGGTVVGLVSVFITGRISKQKNGEPS